jgi:cyclopropane fatty-acyl-phospholipid synthase-like methyltransferase
MKTRTTQEMSAHYYAKLGSRIGYKLVMKKSQHFGFYDKQHQGEDLAQEKYHENINELLNLKPGMSVLDAGCGQGVVGCYLASKNDINLTGITITPHEVKSATNRAREWGVEGRVRFILSDYAATPFEDATFDRIYTTESLSHAPDVNQVIKELTRILKPGGIAVFAEYEMHHQDFDAEMARLAEIIKNHAAIHGVYQFGKGEFLGTLQRNGLKVLGEHDWTKNVKPSFDRLRRLARPLAWFVKKTKQEARFVNTIAAAMYSDGVETGVFAYKVYVTKKK